MRFISCLTSVQNQWLLLLAMAICISGSWTAFRLFFRARETEGFQKAGWIFLASVAAGTSIWCTHFLSILAYEREASVTFEAVLTIVSLIIAICGSGIGFAVALIKPGALFSLSGGSILGAAIAAMHFTGMAAYDPSRFIHWDLFYLILSVAVAVSFGAFSLHFSRHAYSAAGQFCAILVFVLAISGAHHIAMAAMTVSPAAVEATGGASIQIMALAAGLADILIIGTGVASYLIDTSGRLIAFKELEYLALNDQLTQLPNRHSFNEQLDKGLGQAKRDRRKLAVFAIDIDRFKEFNDVQGHYTGDKILKQIGERLHNLAKTAEFVGRVGGDEFSAFLTFSEHSEVMEFAKRLERAFFEPFLFDESQIKIGASIGVSLYPDHGLDRERLIRNADTAMYRAKASVGQSICFFEAAIDEWVRAQRSLTADLRQAIARNEFVVHYQVQVAVASGEIRGHEALLRWKHPVLGFIPPSDFIPLAEESGAILEIGEWVLRTACNEAVSWPQGRKIAVNLSPIQFAQTDLAQRVGAILRETGLPAHRLELEITESTIIADRTNTFHTLRTIKNLGVAISLDDFGTGYSSLDLLRSFPFDKIKLDRSFMSEVETNSQAKAIVQAMLTLGKCLNIPILAEGVETYNQLEILRSEGCDEAQGYFLGRPMPLEQIRQAPKTFVWHDTCSLLPEAV